jgi:glucosamine kinase
MRGPWLGVDAGGTKTHAVLIGPDDDVEAEAIAGPGNPLAVGDEAALGSWRAAVADVIRIARPVAAHFGVAGVGRPQDHARASSLAARTGLVCPVTLSDDARIAFRANAEFPGAILVVGTGSIAVAYDDRGAERRAGGHGYLVGDEGGAYWIGVEAVRAALRAADGRGPATALTDLVPRSLGADSLDGVVTGIYSPVIDRTALARLAPEVVALDDEVARAITTRAVTELVLALEAAVSERGDAAEAGLPIVLAGGLLVEGGSLRRLLVQRLAETMPYADLRRNHASPAVGAARIARSGGH